MNSQKNWNKLNKSTDKINSNLNQSFQYNPRERLMSILKRISESDPVLMTKLSFLKERKKRSYIFQIKNKNESDFNEISNNMSLQEKELLSNVNEFKQDVIDFVKSENKNFNRYAKYKKTNDYFSALYKSYQKKKKKKGDASFLDNEFYFDIANKYLLNNRRLPDMKRNVFNSNPLILDNFQIKKFFINNKVDSKKFMNFLERIKDMTFRKITGDTRLSVEEQKRLENIKENEKPKDYVEPEILIPKLQEEIAKTQFTYDCLINENKSKTIEEPNVKPLLLKSNKDNNFYDIKKLNVTKKINFVDDMNINNNNNINENNNDFSINNKNNDIAKNKNNNNDKNTNNNVNINTSSIDTTTIPLDTRNMAFKTPSYNIFIRKKTHTNIFMSPLGSKLQSNTSHLADFFNNELDNPNSNSNINKNFDPLFYSKSGKNNNSIFLKRSTINNNNSIKIDKELNNSSIFENHKLRLFSPKKRIDFNKFMNNANKIEEKKENQEINIEKEQKEEKEKEKEQNQEINKITPNTMKKNNETKDFFKNILSKSLNNNDKALPKKINLKSKLDFFQKRIPKIIAKKKYKTKTELENEQYQNLENLYNKALHLKSKSFDDQVELENYLLSSKRKQNMNEIMNLKSTYYNIYKMEKNFSKKNLIKEEYSLRNINLNKSIYFTERQKQILNKNKLFTKAFFNNANKFRMIICKKNKEEDN